MLTLFFFSKLWKLKFNWLRQRLRSRPIVNIVKTLDYLCPELVTWLWSPEYGDTNTNWKQINTNWTQITQSHTDKPLMRKKKLTVFILKYWWEWWPNSLDLFVLLLNVFRIKGKTHKSGIFVKRRNKVSEVMVEWNSSQVCVSEQAGGSTCDSRTLQQQQELLESAGNTAGPSPSLAALPLHYLPIQVEPLLSGCRWMHPAVFCLFQLSCFSLHQWIHAFVFHPVALS